MAYETVGQSTLRAETIAKTVEVFALQEYVMKQLVMENSSNSWKESYYQEKAADLTAGATANVRGIPRLAAFPNMETSWNKITAYIEKYGGECTISYEDALTNEIDCVARQLIRVARAVVKAVDTQIWNVLTENQTPSTINSVTIAAGNEWDSLVLANRDPVQTILDSISEIQTDNYNPLNGQGHLVLSPQDFSKLMGNANVRNVGQFYTTIMENGRVGRLLGLTVLVSTVVTADYAAVIIAKEVGTWKQALPLTTVTKYEEFISYTVRSAEMGVCQLINPEACCLIINTQK